GQRVGRRQLARGCVDGARLRNVAEGKIILDGEGIEIALETRVLDQRLELRAEDKLPIREQRVIKRLHAEPVAGEEQRLAVAVPQRKGEHAAEALHAVFAPLLPGVNDDLGVALRKKHVTRARELGDQLLVVVDLAVEDDDDAAVLVEKRLLPGREIDDREPPVPEAQPRLEMQAALVGPAVK